MFNICRQLRLAATFVFFANLFVHSTPLLWIGFILLGVGVISGLDLTERRVELLEKILLEGKDEKAETPKDR